MTKKLKSPLDDLNLKMEAIDPAEFQKALDDRKEERERNYKNWEETERKRFEKILCPVCKSKKKANVIKSDSNGIMGPGYSSWVTEEYLVCSKCGVMYKDLNKPKGGNPYAKKSWEL